MEHEVPAEQNLVSVGKLPMHIPEPSISEKDISKKSQGTGKIAHS